MWNEKFAQLALFVAGWSKDRSTQVGAVIVNDDHCVVSMGYNGAPRGFDDTLEVVHKRPDKYFYVEHAERNAIYNANRVSVSTKDCVMYVTHPPCADCARAIAQSGIRKVYFVNPLEERWGDSLDAAKLIFEQCGVITRQISVSPGSVDVQYSPGPLSRLKRWFAW